MLEQIRQDGLRGVLLVDAENLFYGARSKTPSLLRALDDWARRHVEQPMLFRTYGYPDAIASNWKRTTVVMGELGVVHVPNTIGPDHADARLEADAARVRDVPVQLAIGTGDQDLLGRCLKAVAGGEARIGWIVFSKASRRFPPRPFGKGKVLHGFPRDRTAWIDQIYRDWVSSQDRTDPDGGAGQHRDGAQERSGLSLVPPEGLPWAALRPSDVASLDERWRRAAVDQLTDSGVLSQADARQLASSLQVWLPHAIPGHYQDDLGSLDDDAWTFQCLSAVFAHALVPGTPASDVEARMLRQHLGAPTDLTEAAYSRGVVLVRERFPYDQRNQIDHVCNPAVGYQRPED